MGEGIPSVGAGGLRASSVSSIRRTKTPWCWRANSQLYSALRALPTWNIPVGEGAKRTRTAGVTDAEAIGLDSALCRSGRLRHGTGRHVEREVTGSVVPRAEFSHRWFLHHAPV